jgi:hypothetical protein
VAVVVPLEQETSVRASAESAEVRMVNFFITRIVSSTAMGDSDWKSNFVLML